MLTVKSPQEHFYESVCILSYDDLIAQYTVYSFLSCETTICSTCEYNNTNQSDGAISRW